MNNSEYKYTYLSSDEINDVLGLKHRELTERFNPILREIERSSAEKVNLEMILGIDHGPEQAKKMATELFAFIKEYLTEVFMDIALMQFLSMKKRDEWSIQGGQRIMISFCRCLYRIPPDRQLTQFDADRLLRLIADADERFGQLTGDEYFEISRTAIISLLGIKYALYNLNRLEKLLFRIGCPHNVLSNDENGTPVFILGRIEEEVTQDFTILHVIDEYVRSPHYTITRVASGYGDRRMMIRHESCKIVLFNKWEQFFYTSSSEKMKSNNNPDESIRYNLVRMALEVGGIKSISDFGRLKDNFLAMILDGIIYHELGHKLAKRDRPTISNSMASSFYKTYNIIEVIEEAIADWCPAHGELMGSMARFVERHKMKDPSVSRDFYAYLSDTWFLNSGEQELGLLTEVITAFAIHCIRDDGTIDFDRIENNIDRNYKYLQEMKCLILEGIRNIMSEGSYLIGDTTLSFEELAGYILTMYQNSPDNYTRQEDLFYKHDFWLNLLHYAELFSPETYANMQDTLILYAGQVSRDILNMISGESAYSSLRDYIYRRYEALGVLCRPFIIDPSTLVEMAGSCIGLLDTEKASALDFMKSILDDSNYEIRIDYDTDPSPFIMIIQELMRATGDGNIAEPIGLDIWIKDDSDGTAIYDQIQIELNNLHNRILSNMFPSIERLVVNQTYADLIEEAITDDYELSTGKTLRDYVISIEYDKMDDHHIADAYIKTHVGIMDWNTAIAIFNYNQELRPEAFSKMWIIDKEFITSLAQGYYALHQTDIQVGHYEKN